MTRSQLCLALSGLTVFLLGTVVVLSTVVAYFGVDLRDVITEREMRRYEGFATHAAPGRAPLAENRPPSDTAAPAHAEEPHVDQYAIPERADQLRKRQLDPPPLQRIPKIVHQTWKVNELPDKWEHVREQCMALHPEYEYKLWSDASARAFLAVNYPWFVHTFDHYPYPIQRADAIRYFVLHHYGGIYMDLDVGCERPLDPLLYFPVILPATKPVGVSNDVMLSEKGHPFMNLVIHSLIPFNHQYGTNYPTVMFSTGPMFLSAQYGRWPKLSGVMSEVRVLPRRWYGKNAPIEERGEAFFAHYYGSSWHSNDAGFITFLGKFGISLMYLGLAIVILGAIRLIWSKRAVVLKTPLLSSAPGKFPYHFSAELLPTSLPSTPNPNLTNSFSATMSTLPTTKGVLAYLPVWLDFSTDEVALPQHSRPSSPTMWRTSIEQKNDHRYRAVPSRPHSPSASLNIPTEREVSPQFHSLPPSRSVSSSRPCSRSPSPPPGATASLIHQPLSNTATLAAWGVGLFRSKSIEVSKKSHSTRTSPQRSTAPLSIDTRTYVNAASTTNGNGAPPNYQNQLNTSEHSFRYPLPSHGDVDSFPSLDPHPSLPPSAPPSPRQQRRPADEEKGAGRKRETNEQQQEHESDGGRGRIDGAQHLAREMSANEGAREKQ